MYLIFYEIKRHSETPTNRDFSKVDTFPIIVTFQFQKYIHTIGVLISKLLSVKISNFKLMKNLILNEIF